MYKAATKNGSFNTSQEICFVSFRIWGGHRTNISLYLEKHFRDERFMRKDVVAEPLLHNSLHRV